MPPSFADAFGHRQLVFDPLTETDRRALQKALTKLLPGLLGDC